MRVCERVSARACVLTCINKLVYILLLALDYIIVITVILSPHTERTLIKTHRNALYVNGSTSLSKINEGDIFQLNTRMYSARYPDIQQNDSRVPMLKKIMIIHRLVVIS